MISLVAAVGLNLEIGQEGKLPWEGLLPRDMAHFKRLTEGHAVVMGRKTRDSLGIEALPNRENFVLTENRDYQAKDTKTIHYIDDIMSRNDEVMIIGGGEIYTLFLPYADRIYLTVVGGTFERADTFFPKIDFLENWYDTVPADLRPEDESNKLWCIYRTLQRIPCAE
jgi:dihydrofolate reductase